MAVAVTKAPARPFARPFVAQANRGRVVVAVRNHFGRAGLRVPAHELRELGVVRVREAFHELIDRRRLAIVALEVEVHALPEGLGADQGLQHADDLGALLVEHLPDLEQGGLAADGDQDVAGAPGGAVARAKAPASGCSRRA